MLWKFYLWDTAGTEQVATYLVIILQLYDVYILCTYSIEGLLEIIFEKLELRLLFTTYQI